MNNPNKIKSFIKNNSELFWYIKPEEKENISNDYLVETILNFGTRKDVKRLFRILGMKTVADIFYKNTSGLRTNYRKKVINFFNLYFEHNSYRNPYKRARKTFTTTKGFF